MAANTNTANFNASAAVAVANHSPSSPNQSHRAIKAASTPWTEMFRGENEPIAGISLTSSSSSLPLPSTALTQPPVAIVDEGEGVDSQNAGTNGNAGKKPAWKKTSKDDAKVGAVMGTNKWPALSESAKVPSKSSSDSPRASSDGSSTSLSVVSVSQGNGSAMSSTSQTSPVSNNTNLNTSPNHITPTRQKSMKRNSNNSASNGGLSQLPTQDPVVESPVNSPSSRNHVQRSGFVSQSHTGGNNQPHSRNSYRHRNGGLYPRGDGSHHQNFGGRRNQDHGSHEWNGRNFNSRDGQGQPRVAHRVMRHPPPPPPPPVPNTIPFIGHTPMRPFGIPMAYPDMAHLYMVPAPPPDSLRGLSFVAPMPQVFFPAPEPHDNQLHVSIVNQINYYFSEENLITDTYLRQNMDEQGWVPIKLIAGFKKVSLLTDNIQLITDALQSSTVVEVQGDKVRRQNDWMRWIMSPVQFPTISGPDTLVSRVQNISLEQRNTNQSGARGQGDSNAGELSCRPSFGNNNLPPLFNSEGTTVSGQGGPANPSN